MVHNPGDVCQLPAASIQSPVNEAFKAAQVRFPCAQDCLVPEHVALMEQAKTRCYGKSRPCVILENHMDAGSCTVALFCTFDGEDINAVAPVYRCFALGVYPTTRIPECPAEDYALEKDTDPLRTTPQWRTPRMKEDPTKVKDQWILTYPLTLAAEDVGKLRPWRGSVSVDQSELERLRCICDDTLKTFLKRFDSPAKLKMASMTFMTNLKTLKTQKSRAISTATANHYTKPYDRAPSTYGNVLVNSMQRLGLRSSGQSIQSAAPSRRWTAKGFMQRTQGAVLRHMPSQVSVRAS